MTAGGGRRPSLRVVFLGNDPWSVPSLEAVAASAHRIVLVGTRVPRPAGRGSRLRPTAVAEAARRLGLPLAEVETVRGGEGFDAVRSARPDVLVVVAYGEILPPDVLHVPSIGPVNVHFSLLPWLRGASPVQTALLEGLPVTGVTTMLMDEGLDTGPILLQQEEPVREDDDAGSLGRRLAEVGGRLLARTLDLLATGEVVPAPQDHARATVAPKLGPEARRLDWSEDAETVIRRVRALSPEPAASARFRDAVLKVFRAELGPGDGEPGSVLVASKEGFVVAAGRGAVRLLVVAPEGRKRMTGPEFVRGYRPREGERLA